MHLPHCISHMPWGLGCYNRLRLEQWARCTTSNSNTEVLLWMTTLVPIVPSVTLNPLTSNSQQIVHRA
jgi:hypothetical protein